MLDDNTYTLVVTPRQHDTILAALRFWQRCGLGLASTEIVNGMPLPESEIATWNGAALTHDEIDGLCEEIN